MSAHERLPARIDPWRFVAREVELDGHLAVKGLSRLTGQVSGHGEFAAVALEFEQDPQRRVVIRCRVSASVTMVCQRCLQPMEVALNTDSVLAVVRSEDEARDLPRAYEPVLADEGMIELARLVEDELILALPFAPRHEEGVCHRADDDGEPAREAAADDHPFAVLQSLRRRQ